MRSKGNAPTAAQRRWQDVVAGLGCIVTRSDPAHCQLHHVGGFTYKHNKIRVGPWFILPLHASLHDLGSENPCNVTHHRRAFTDKFGTQAHLFLKVVYAALYQGHDIPFDVDVLNAIKDSPL